MAEHEKGPISRPRLGRGLSSLINSLTETPSTMAYAPEHAGSTGPKAAVQVPSGTPGQATLEVPLDQIGPNPYQPRRDFQVEELAELAASIAKHGVLQPIRLTTSADPSAPKPYTVVAGERRLRAAKMAGLQTIPCVIGPATQEQMFQWAIVENVHRSDLNPIERGEAYLQFLNRFHISQADLAESLGEPRTTISNYMRILDLEQAVRDMIASGSLSFGHAKVLAGLVGKGDAQLQIARRAQSESLSVRQLEEVVAAVADGTAAQDPFQAPARPRPAYLRDLEERLSGAVGTRVSVWPGRKKNTGRLVIEYYSLDDFDRLSALLGVNPE
jgi:ParB family transcriptional regulator, chromosome partitioning protein